jgi:hypothetical protein
MIKIFPLLKEKSPLADTKGLEMSWLPNKTIFATRVRRNN